MQYTKPMIDLVYEIRRRVDANMKPSVKMANPDVLKELAEYHHHTTDNITKTLIKELLFLAGPTWVALLDTTKSFTEKMSDHPKQVVKVYRGQTTLVDAPQATESKKVRMYRGAPIVG